MDAVPLATREIPDEIAVVILGDEAVAFPIRSDGPVVSLEGERMRRRANELIAQGGTLVLSPDVAAAVRRDHAGARA